MPTADRLVMEQLFRIADKDGNDVDFKCNPAQSAVDELWHNRIIIPKARQEGVSSYVLARWALKCLYKRNTRAVVISHETDATQRMFSKVKYYLDNIKGPKPVIETRNKNELTFPKTNSVFYIGTAGAKKFGRGDTITDLHCSEAAYWDDPKALTAGLFQAVPRQTGTIAVESTGNGAGNWYHNLCMRAAKGLSSFRLCFLPWHKFPEYRLATTPEEAEYVFQHLSPELGEISDDPRNPGLVQQYGLTAGQVLFRRMVLEELDFDMGKWNQEYPSCLDDCFQATGSGIFQKVQYVATDDWVRHDHQMWLLKPHPIAGHRYVLGADVGGGVRKDASVMEIIDIDLGIQVGEWISNQIAPDTFAVHIARVGQWFNGAYVAVEANNHGIVTVKGLHGTYPSNLLHRTELPKSSINPVNRLLELGVRTTVRSKPLIVGDLRQALAGDLVIHSAVLKNELSTFVEHEDGKMGAQEGCNDDTVMAMGIANFVRPKAIMAIDRAKAEKPKGAPDPFSLEGMIDEMTGRRGGLPFPAYIMEPGV